MRMHPLAAVSLDSFFEETAFKADKGWRTLRKNLESAQSFEPSLPSTLQAELRPYQVDGYRWLARLSPLGSRSMPRGRHGTWQDRPGTFGAAGPRSIGTITGCISHLRGRELGRRGAPVRSNSERQDLHRKHPDPGMRFCLTPVRSISI